MKDGKEPFAHRMIRWWSASCCVFSACARCAMASRWPIQCCSWPITPRGSTSKCCTASARPASWPRRRSPLAAGRLDGGHWRHHFPSARQQPLAGLGDAGDGRATARGAVRWRCSRKAAVGSTACSRCFTRASSRPRWMPSVPVQPVALRFARDGRRVIDAGFREGESFMANIVRLLGSAPLDAEVHFLDAGAGQPGCTAPHGRTVARAHRRRTGRSPGRMSLPHGKDFRPPWPLRSGHIQTMLSSSGVRRVLLPARRRPCCRMPSRCWSMAVAACASVAPTPRSKAVRSHAGWPCCSTAGKAASIPPMYCRPAVACSPTAGTSSG